jgi:hypothetical protein
MNGNLMDKKQTDSLGPVPCNGCTRCCRGDAIRIMPHEDPSKWKTVEHHLLPGHRMLAHKQNGDCIYLGDGGCTINDSKPEICQSFDCRLVYLRVSFTHARKYDKAGTMRIQLWEKGRDLLREHGKKGGL